jgi:monofunctional biosynthetic peptidoglycan transglycosylase
MLKKVSPLLILKIFLRVVAGFLVTSLALVLIYRFVPVYYTPLMAIRSLQSVFGPSYVSAEHKWVPYEKISPAMKRAVIKAEDYKFFDHNGFDYDAIQKAMKYNATHAKKKGASTITQQTAKNVFLFPDRSWVRKGLEAYFTVMIETVWPKERILEVYLNVIELGHGVYGVEAASQRFFRKPAAKINPYEASLLAAVLPNPRRFRVERPSGYVMKRQRRIMRRAAPILAATPTVMEDPTDLKLEEETEQN